ncbi:MAG TPA: DUF4293 family protein, partial [Saprospiraceae bacterium]|nr:DUF4293 family protein [Saprospiraceae bacterium]
ALFFLPLAGSSTVISPFFGDQRYDLYDHPAMMTNVILGILVAIITIFLYKNRKLQIIGAVIMILQAITFPGVAYGMLLAFTPQVLASSNLHLQPGFFITLLVIPLALLAIAGIRKDNKLIKSMDRLR